MIIDYQVLKTSIEQAYTLTYGKLREKEGILIKGKDIIGIFLNYLYKVNPHISRTIDVRDFEISTLHGGLYKIEKRYKYLMYQEPLSTIVKIMTDMSYSDLYNLYLQSSFSRPLLYEEDFSSILSNIVSVKSLLNTKNP